MTGENGVHNEGRLKTNEMLQLGIRHGLPDMNSGRVGTMCPAERNTLACACVPMAASVTFALKAGVWFRRGRLLMVAPDSQTQRACCQAETPFIVLSKFPGPALASAKSDSRSRSDATSGPTQWDTARQIWYNFKGSDEIRTGVHQTSYRRQMI